MLKLRKWAKTVKDVEGAGQSNNLLYSRFHSEIVCNLHAPRVGCVHQALGSSPFLRSCGSLCAPKTTFFQVLVAGVHISKDCLLISEIIESPESPK